jgi:hypothetical protein
MAYEQTHDDADDVPARAIVLQRRELLVSAARLACGAACVGALGALMGRAIEGSAGAAPGPDDPAPGGYTQAVLSQSFNEAAPFFSEVITARHSKALAGKVKHAARADWAKLAPQIPYVGEADWPLPATLIGSAVALSFYRALKHAGVGKAEAKALVSRQGRASLAAVPPAKLAEEGAEQFTEEWYAMQRQYAALSQLRHYPGDWVYSFVEGVPGEFDWGWDFTECGVLKLFATQHGLDLMPSICVQDFYVSAAQKTGLRRTKTLAKGCGCCDFRYEQGRPVSPS